MKFSLLPKESHVSIFAIGPAEGPGGPGGGEDRRARTEAGEKGRTTEQQRGARNEEQQTGKRRRGSHVARGAGQGRGETWGQRGHARGIRVTRWRGEAEGGNQDRKVGKDNREPVEGGGRRREAGNGQKAEERETRSEKRKGGNWGRERGEQGTRRGGRKEKGGRTQVEEIRGMRHGTRREKRGRLGPRAGANQPEAKPQAGPGSQTAGSSMPAQPRKGGAQRGRTTTARDAERAGQG
ncbi:Hypothetical predicted protein [Mytilus galloprovincialis]|uniref:Uncharacterized protein n=1 Tax=Mytilus galloprovincialis TaxID=29158 RepID=A0A8B6GIQ1_MYTGA|nr:Hypothetical predicted protein [Mytilus galloprovincialis]